MGFFPTRDPQLRSFAGQMKEVNSAAVSPDATTIATGGAMGQVRLWDVQSERELYSLSAGATSVLAIAFSRDGSSLAASDGLGRITRWYAHPVPWSTARL